jgi:glutamyl-tRNA reductase
MHRRKNRPMFFIDIAVPRDVDPEMGQVDGIFTYNIDDLQQIVESNVSDRGREAQRAEALIEEEVVRFRRRMQTLDAVPTILALQQRMEQIRQDEIERLRAKLGPLTAEQQSAIENLTRSIVNKILHPPISALKSASGSEELTTTSEILRALFGLELASHTDGLAHAQEGSSPSIPKQSRTELSADKSEADHPILKFTARS